MKRLLSVVPLLIVAGCATSTTIITDPPGAKVFQEAGEKGGEKKELGVTPYKYETSMWLWDAAKLTVVDGEKSKSIELKRSEFDMLPGIGGICLTLTVVGCVAGVPLFLAGGLKLPPETKVSFDDESGTPSSSPVSWLAPAPAQGRVAY